MSISNDGKVAFAGLDNTSWDIQQSGSRVNRGDTATLIASLPTNNFIRQESADNSLRRHCFTHEHDKTHRALRQLRP